MRTHCSHVSRVAGGAVSAGGMLGVPPSSSAGTVWLLAAEMVVEAVGGTVADPALVVGTLTAEAHTVTVLVVVPLPELVVVPIVVASELASASPNHVAVHAPLRARRAKVLRQSRLWMMVDMVAGGPEGRCLAFCGTEGPEPRLGETVPERKSCSARPQARVSQAPVTALGQPRQTVFTSLPAMTSLIKRSFSTTGLESTKG
jgi:hypothetical protein